MSDWSSDVCSSDLVRVRNLLFLYAPTMRNWMSARSDSLHEIIPLGSPVKTLAAGRIVESLDPRYPVGSRITAMSCWSEYDIIDTASTPQIIADGISAVEALGPFGLNSLIAYFELGKAPCWESVCKYW